MQNLCTVTVLLTEYHDLFSVVFYYLTGRTYTHASIALEQEPDDYYSFNFHGFCRETLEKHRRRGVTNSVSYTLNVTESNYSVLKCEIAEFWRHSNEFHYTRLGAICCILHIPLRWKRHYFCSQFVVELLQEVDILSREKAAALYTPSRLAQELNQNRAMAHKRLNPV